jgi:hypothetical protein
MNNTKTLTAIAAILMAATLVVGGTLASSTAFAYQKKGPQDNKKGARDNGSGNGNGNTITVEKCKNRGSASGFDTTVNQECENLICTHPGENATCTQEGVGSTPTSTPEPITTTLLVIKKVACVTVPFPCGQPSGFTLHVTGNNPRPSTSFRGSESGTLVTLDPGPFTVFDEVDDTGVTFTGDCTQHSSTATGTIAAGQHLTCTATNFPGQ